MPIKYPGHGAKLRPHHLKIKDHIFGAVTPAFDWSKVQEDSVGPVANLFNVPDKDQGGSLSCTVQTTGYGFTYKTGIEISREDIYSQVRLPGGGAYLNAPLDFLRNKGYVLLSKYPDPHPETEDNMMKMITVQDGDRIRTFAMSYKFFGNDIDSVAFALSQSDYVHLGIKGSWVKGWESSWVDPYYAGQEDWAHALFVSKESIVLRNGIPAIKAKSSWCEHVDPKGNQVFCHYLNKPYFTAGGIFETIGVTVKEITEVLTKPEVKRLQALEGYSDPAGVDYWGDGTHTLDQYLAARLPDKVKTINDSLQ